MTYGVIHRDTIGIMETWRSVVGYEGLYEVSDQGRVRSTRRRGAPGGLIAQRLNKRGRYPIVGLTKNCQGSTRPVHALLAEAFIGPRPLGHQVRHLDGDPTNCTVENLAYGTPSENQADKQRHGRDHNLSKTHCIRGHELSPDNLRACSTRPNARYCLTCEKLRGRERSKSPVEKARSRARYHARLAAMSPVQREAERVRRAADYQRRKAMQSGPDFDPSWRVGQDGDPK